MIRLPDIGLASKPQPQPTTRFDDDAEWDGPAMLGIDAMSRDMALRKGWNLIDGTLAEHRFVAWTREEDARLDAAAAELAPLDARGFAERTTAESFARAKAFAAALPPAARPAFDARLAAYQHGLFARAGTVEDSAQFQAARALLEESLESTVVPAAAAAGALPAGDPDKFDRLTALKAQRHTLIDNNPALSQFAKDERKAAETRAIDTAFAEALPPEEKQDLDPDAPIETIGARIRRLEGERQAGEGVVGAVATSTDAFSGNPDGFGQEAWLNAIRKHRPEFGEGKSYPEILALRADPELSAEMRERGLADSARYLAAHGHKATPGDLYLAHATASGTALRLLEADPQQLAADVDPLAAKALPDLFFAAGNRDKPRTVAEVLAHAEILMDGTRIVDWRQPLGGVSSEMRVALAADGREAIALAEAEAKRVEAESYRRRIEGVENSIDLGTFGHADLVKAAGEGGWVKAEDFTRLFNRLAKRSALLEYEQFRADFSDPDQPFDLNSPEHQSAVDRLYAGDPASDASAVLDGDPAARAHLRTTIARTGLVPSQVLQTIEAAHNSGNEGDGLRASALSQDILLWAVYDAAPEDAKIIHEIISETRRLFNQKIFDIVSISELLAKYGSITDFVTRDTIQKIAGAGGIFLYDKGIEFVDERINDLRNFLHSETDRVNVDGSALEIQNQKTVFDAIITLATIAAPGLRSGKTNGRGGKNGDFEDPLPSLPPSLRGRITRIDEPEGWGNFPRVKIKTTPGRTSDAVPGTDEYKALNNPEPNTIYELDNGTIFRTNAAGRVDRREFTPDPDNERGRKSVLLDEERPEGFDKAHLHGAKDGGPSDKSNVFYQNANFNRGVFRVWEDEMSKRGAERVRVDLVRNGDQRTLRADEVHGRFLLDGQWYKVEFNNAPGGLWPD